MSDEKLIPKWKVGSTSIKRYPACIILVQDDDIVSIDNEYLEEFIALLQEAKDTQVK